MNASASSMGQALVETGRGRLAYVFYGRLERQVGMQMAGDCLGSVMAHETAHLLGLPHSVSGLMRSEWSQSDWALASQGGLFFSTTEAELLRRRLAR